MNINSSTSTTTGIGGGDNSTSFAVMAYATHHYGKWKAGVEVCCHA